MLLVADCVVHGHKVEPCDTTKPHDDLRKKVLSHHRKMGVEDAFEYGSEQDDYFKTRKSADRAPHMRFINEHQATCRQLLADKLAKRDLAAQPALSTAQQLEGKQRALKLFEITCRYPERFAENRLDSVRLMTKADRMH